MSPYVFLRRDRDHPARVVLIFSALAVAVTWPLAAHLGDSIPSDLGDPLLNAWILGWDADRFRHGFTGLWDAPIFYPYHHTLAFSEHLLGIAVFVAPIFWATGNPLIAYNVAFLLSFVLAGAGMFLLVRELTGSSEAAWIAGLIFAFSPARFGQIGHLQVLMSGWMPLSLWALHRFITKRSALSLTAFVAFVLVQCLSNNYFIYFLALPAAIVALHGLRWAPSTDRPRVLGGLAIAAGLIVAALAPIAVIYFRVRREFGFRRTLEDATNFGADLATYLHGNDGVRPPLTLWRHLPFVVKPQGPEESSSPAQWRSLWRPSASRSGAAAGGTRNFAAPASTWRSPQLRFCSRLESARRPGMFTCRSAGSTRCCSTCCRVSTAFACPRISVVVLLAVAVLAGIGVSALLRGRRRPIAWALTGVFAVTIFLEGYAAPMPLAFVGRGGRMDRGAYNWIREHAPGPILELPDGNLASLLQPFGYDYQTLFHRQPIVNGSSGYSSALSDFISGASSPLIEPSGFGDGLRLLRGSASARSWSTPRRTWIPKWPPPRCARSTPTRRSPSA